ncbi:MAG: EF-P lysine aminoacylase GenX [Salinisphaeraceae bacterium]|nr:EF-P lysine aminoacylase GenX [Salinisphaeraceae bacterium]
MPEPLAARLRRRARLLACIRAFFAERQVLEVDTPLLTRGPATDPHLASLQLQSAATGRREWLITSPESGLKQLLAAGSGDVYQLGHVFRSDEAGRWHAPEFCMLEWYRCGWDTDALMTEIEALIAAAAGAPFRARRISYGALFQRHAGLDIFSASRAELRSFAIAQGLYSDSDAADGAADIDFWRDLILSTHIQPRLTDEPGVFVTGFPASQASLTRVDPDDPRLAQRFELYWRGVELANGGQEATRAAAVRARMASDNNRRAALGLTRLPEDEALLDALESGLPACAGVALGVDRLLALLAGWRGIAPGLPLGRG